jgi:hypothetical protein
MTPLGQLLHRKLNRCCWCGAIMESTQDAEMYLGLLIPHNHRWRYRIAEHRTVILL